jgi:hypothetical protein
MRTRIFAATALLTGVLALTGGTAAQATEMDPKPVVDSLEDALLTPIGVNVCENSIGLPSLTVGDHCAKS